MSENWDLSIVDGREALARCFNSIIKTRIKHGHVKPEDLSGYLDATADIYLVLTEADKMLAFEDETLSLIISLERKKERKKKDHSLSISIPS